MRGKVFRFNGREAPRDPATIMKAERQVCLFFSGSVAVAAGHLVSADLVERVGSYAVALEEEA